MKKEKLLKLCYLYLLFYKYANEDTTENNKIDFYIKNEWAREKYLNGLTVDDREDIKTMLYKLDKKLCIAVLHRELDFILDGIIEDIENL